MPPMTGSVSSGRRRSDADSGRIPPPVRPPVADGDAAANSRARRPEMRALPQAAPCVDLHLHLEDARSAIFRDSPLSHDLDQRGIQGMAQSARASLLAAPR